MLSLNSYEDYLKQNIEDAFSLPFEAYTSSDIFSTEVDNIFHKDWVFACSEQEIPMPGDYKVLTFLNESVMIIRQKDHSIKALLNNCRHRGTKLLDDGRGNSKKIICPYHAWSYSNDGKLKGAPFTGNIKIEKEKHCLKGIKIESWQSLVFINFNGEAQSIAKRYSGLNRYFKAFDSSRFKYATEDSIEKWSCNWKIAMENAMESYHLFAVHNETLEKTTPTKKAYYVEGGADWTLTGGAIVDIKSKFMDMFKQDKYNYLDNYLLISLPPSFVGILTYDSFAWIQILPDDVGKISVISGGLSSNKGKTPKSIQDFVNKFFKEDEAICERMQESMKSKISSGGKLVELEKVIVDFRQYIAKYSFAAKVDSHMKSERVNDFPSDVPE
ncbi:MAG: hypothetical protein BM556_05725 [Bacteriovorax sp. MedPE-SWde]|nr:MAG: hypothetical protein BM556_05725 [Bacteriovorax sp. MedPE-SWde]